VAGNNRYGTWSEDADGHGNVPYVTSGSGFLQSVLYGFAGVRALQESFRVKPQLPAGVARVALRRLQYCGGHFDLEYNTSVAWLTRVDGPLYDMPSSFPTGTVALIKCP